MTETDRENDCVFGLVFDVRIERKKEKHPANRPRYRKQQINTESTRNYSVFFLANATKSYFA